MNTYIENAARRLNGVLKQVIGTSCGIVFAALSMVAPGTSHAQFADPALSTAAFFPIRTLIGTTSELRFTFSNSGSTAIPPASVELAICPAFAYYTTDGVTPPFGPLASQFNWTPPTPFDPMNPLLFDGCWRGINNAAIAGFAGGQINLTYNANALTSGPEITNINVQLIANFTAFRNGSGNDNLQPELEISEFPDLTVVKTASVANATQGANFSYSIRVSNNGAGPSLPNTIITDTLPAGITLTGVTQGAGWICTPAVPPSLVGPNTLSCRRVAGVNPGVANQLVATLNVTKTVLGDVANTATVTSGDPACASPLPVRCTSTVTVGEPPTPTVGVVKTDPVITNVTGNTYTAQYSISVGNTGGAAGVYTLNDTPGFASGATVNSWTVTTTGGTVNVPLPSPVNGASSQISAAAVAIAPATTHTYIVTINFTMTPSVTAFACVTNTAGNGAFNLASISGSSTATGSGCASLPAAADMTSTITAPAVGAPGATVNGTITCTNGGPAAATTVTCTPSTATLGATLTPGACTINGTPATLPVASLSNVAPSNAIICAFTVSIPANPANSDVGPTTVDLAGTTSAANETVAAAANNGSVGSIAIIDAVNDSLGTIGSTAGGTTPSVLANDLVGATAANAAVAGGNVVITTPLPQGFIGTGTASVLVLNPTTGVITVPANATPGVYTVPYTICSTVVPTACDAAVATVTVSDTSADMTSTITAPAVGAPGATVNGTITCTNGGPAAATTVTCTPSTTTLGATLTPGACTINGAPATLPVANLSNVAPNNAIICAFTVSIPANPGSSDVGPTTIALVGTTSAANETVAAAANNGSVGSIAIIDAVNDNLGTIGSTAGGVTASVLGSDQVGVPAANAAVVGGNVVLTTPLPQGFTGTGTPSVLVLNPTTGVITVPANATPGVYTVPYTICSTLVPTACDGAVATVTVTGAPALQVTKIAGVPTVAAGINPDRTDAGDTVAYSFSVRNTGNVDLNNVTISDPKLPSLICTPVALLAVGATSAVACASGNTYTLTAADVLAGSTTNVATGVGTAPPDTCGSPPCLVTGTGTATVPSTPNSGITVTKLANPGVLPALGGVITYTILVENTGKTALTNVIVTDPVAGTVTCPGGNPIPTLTISGPGSSVTCTASYTVTPSDVLAGSKTNVATATGTAPPTSCALAPCTVTGSGTSTVSAPSSAPEIKVVKKASPTTAATIGQIIDYTIVGSNTGNVTLTNVSISDDKIAALTCLPVAPATLLVGETITCIGSYTLTAADAAAGSLTNIATAMGTPPSGPPVTATGTATTPVVPIANDDIDSTTLNQPVATPVSPNDSYPPGSTVSTGGTSTNGGTVVCTSATPAICTYTPPTGFVGTDTYTYRLCLPAPNSLVCDTAIVTITISASDMGVSITGLPATASPGAAFTGVGVNVVCTNTSASAATNATCTAAAGAPAGAVVTTGVCVFSAGSSAASVLANGTITCPLTVTMPGTAGGTDTTPTSVGVNGATSATNDGNAGNNTTAVAINLIDALDDSVNTPFGIAATLNVLTNAVGGSDTVGASPAVLGGTPNVTLTQTVAPSLGSTFNAVTGDFSVPNNAPPGVYTVSYQICTNPATVPAACDTAIATITVGSGSTVSGNVFNDLNGATDSLVNGAGTNTGAAGALAVYLVNPLTGAVVAETTVSPAGIYTFPLVADGNYNIVLSTTAGLTTNPAASLPAGWVNTGEGLTTAGTAPVDGVITNVAVTGASISGANFGIEQRPLGQDNTAVPQANPGGVILVAVPATTFTTGATDPSGGTVTGYNVGFPTGVDSMTVNGTNYDAAAFLLAFPGGSVFVLVANIGNIQVDPAGTGTGPGTVQIPFRPVDNATIASSTLYNATVPLVSGSSVSGNVFDDGDGLTDSLVNGTGTNAGGLTAYLVSTAGAVIASSPVAANGSYSFANVVDGTYSVVISATAGQSLNPTTNLPTNWVNTGEGVLSAGDGVVDGRVLGVVVNAAPVSAVNFGIEQRPVAGGIAASSQANPGGTTSVPVAATVFQTGTTDADGVVTSYLITALPANATSITINGVPYAAVLASGFLPFPPGGVTVPAALIGSVTVDPIDGATTVVIPFTVTDNAGVTSANVGGATVPFTPGVADLAIQKNGPAAVLPGSNITYTITLINNGLSAADGASFIDTLPPGLTGVTATCTGTAGSGTSLCAAIPITLAAGSISGSVPQFPSGGSVLLTVRGTAPAVGPLVNTVTISPPPGVIDIDQTNNTSSVTTRIGTPPTEADLGVIKTGPSVVSVSGVVSYVIDVVNAGPGPADGSLFTDTVPAVITGVSWTCTASGQALCPAASGTGNSIVQTIATMPMNGRLRYAVTGTAPATATTLLNTATVATPAGITDPNPTNDTSSVSTLVTSTPPTVANLSMSKVGPSTVAAFGVVRYTLVATNNGPAAADGAIVSDTFPNALTGVSWTCSASVGASCGAASGSGNLNLTLPVFAAGSQVTIVVIGTAPGSGTFQNSSRVIAPPTVFDPDPTDNIGGPVITTVLLAPADLVTTITLSPTGSLLPGQPVTATVVMSNIGPSPAGNVVVTLQLIPGSSSVVVGGGGVFNPATNTVTWPNIPFVPANTSPVVTYVVTFVPPSTGGPIRSDVITPDVEVTLVNNPASVPISVSAPPPPPPPPANEPEPIPTTPWWLIALVLAGFAGRSVHHRKGAKS